MTPLKSNQIRKMEIVGQLAAKTLAHVGSFVKDGVTTNELDQIAYDYTLSHNATPAPLNYKGFPKSICTSVNECVCHGVPDDTPLKKGDIVNIDITCIKDGFHGDTSMMFFVGDEAFLTEGLGKGQEGFKESKASQLDEFTQQQKAVVECAFKAMWKGIEVISPLAKTGDIGFAINKHTTKKGFSTVKEIGGHGIGQIFHAEPFVPSFGKKGHGQQLKPWICLTVEPMINENSDEIIEFSIPNSEIKYYTTKDKGLSAQFEHTVLVTDSGYKVLTLID